MATLESDPIDNTTHKFSETQRFLMASRKLCRALIPSGLHGSKNISYETAFYDETWKHSNKMEA